MARNRKVLLVLVAVAVVAVGGFLLWFYVIKDDAPPALTSADRDRALTTTSVSGPASVDPGSSAPGSSAPTSASPTTGAGGNAASGVDGAWTIAAGRSTVGYRVKEILAGLETEGAGRTDQVTGTLTIAGTQASAATFEVDMKSITSNSDRRDSQFHGRIMSTDEFPTSTFTLTEPIDFGTVPAAGQAVRAQATGELTLHGQTRSVTFEVDAKLEGGAIGVVGSIPITFADYGIPNPTNSFAKTEDNGLLEFVLVFTR